MRTWVALFRGINVMGNNVLPMKALQGLLEQNGCREVRTYIQSGNVVFRSAHARASAVERKLGALVAASHGFQPRVLALGLEDLEQAAAGNPFPRAAEAPTTVHLFFLAEVPPAPDLEGLAALATATERFELKGRVFYLHTPDGFGPSKLAARAERLLGVHATARNWRTVTTLVELAKAR